MKFKIFEEDTRYKLEKKLNEFPMLLPESERRESAWFEPFMANHQAVRALRVECFR